MPIQHAFPIPLYYNKPTEEDYELIQKELVNVHENTDYEVPGRFPKNASHSLTPNPFESNVIKKYKCDVFLEFLKTSIRDYLQNLQYRLPMEYIIDASWITKNTLETYAIEHTHGATDISGVYYIKTNGKDGNLYFNDPNQGKLGNLIMGLSVQQNIAPLEQGLLILWPGFLSHGTHTNKSDHERLSLSFNIKFARRGFTIKDNVDDTRCISVRDDTWRDIICYEELN